MDLHQRDDRVLLAILILDIHRLWPSELNGVEGIAFVDDNEDLGRHGLDGLDERTTLMARDKAETH